MEKSTKHNLLISETLYWNITLKSDQTYLGSCLVTLKRNNCGDLVDVTADELLDFLQAVKILEHSIRQAFSATMFNWSCLMNSAYQRIPPDPHVHWQFIPRYSKPVSFAGLEFIDANFGRHYKRETTREVDSVVREKIVAEIKKCIS